MKLWVWTCKWVFVWVFWNIIKIGCEINWYSFESRWDFWFDWLEFVMSKINWCPASNFVWFARSKSEFMTLDKDMACIIFRWSRAFYLAMILLKPISSMVEQCAIAQRCGFKSHIGYKERSRWLHSLQSFGVWMVWQTVNEIVFN